jgi:pSer/pThr/pTyr-binding forkhead associated (FHA) protein
MAGAHYRLVMRQGPNPGQVYELDRSEVSVGRDIANDIVINDAEVSRKHAQLTLEVDRYKIEDLNSTNGTYIDGQRLIGPHLLAIGEVIMFGDNVGVVFDGEPVDLDATVPSPVDLGSTPVAAIPVPMVSQPQPAPTPALQVSQRQPAPAHAPQVSAVPKPQQTMPELPLEGAEEMGKKPINSWLLAGCGCLVVIVLLVIAVLVFIDQPWNSGGGLYCVSPFDIIFKALGFCP